MTTTTPKRGQTYIELIALDILKVQGNRVLSGFDLVHVADTMRCQVNLAILLVRELVFSGTTETNGSISITPSPRASVTNSPFVQTDIVLHEEQVLICQVRRPQSGCQVDLL